MIKLRRLRCSFCRKNELEVSKLVAGPRVYICDRCVAIASRMMEDDSQGDSPQTNAAPSVTHKLWARVRRSLRGRGGSSHRVSDAVING